jgi:hypothetical protein
VAAASGTYPNQIITGTKAAPGVVFDLSNGARVSGAQVYASWVEFRNGRIDSYWWDNNGAPPDHVTFRNIEAESFFMNGGSNISVIGGTLGPHASDGINYIFSDRSAPISNVVIDGLHVHDNTCVSSGCHYEAIRIDQNAVGVTIRNSRFERNAIFHVFITDSGFSEATVPRNITIESNVFDRPIGGGYAIKTQEPSVQTCRNYTIRNNRFANAGAIALTCPTKLNVVVEGNAFG